MVVRNPHNNRNTTACPNVSGSMQSHEKIPAKTQTRKDKMYNIGKVFITYPSARR